MTTPKELVPKPSDAVQAMIDGLKNPNRKFNLNMSTYGVENPKCCVGCAATAAVLQIDPNLPIDENVRDTFYHNTYGEENKQWTDFEIMINNLRIGINDMLKEYYDVNIPQPEIYLRLLDSHNWEERLPAYEAYAEQLRNAGF